MTSEPAVDTKIYLTLVDIIFGVLIGATLVTLAPQLVPVKLQLFETWSIYVAFLIIILSWIFYHKAVFEQELKIDLMIIIDLFLLFLYFYILFSYNNFPHYVVAVTIMFGLYLLWTIVRDYGKKKKKTFVEYYKSDIKNQLKLGRSIGIFVASVILLILYNYFTAPDYSVETVGDEIADSIVLGIIALFACLYRAIPYFYK